MIYQKINICCLKRFYIGNFHLCYLLILVIKFLQFLIKSFYNYCMIHYYFKKFNYICQNFYLFKVFNLFLQSKFYWYHVGSISNFHQSFHKYIHKSNKIFIINPIIVYFDSYCNGRFDLNKIKSRLMLINQKNQYLEFGIFQNHYITFYNQKLIHFRFLQLLGNLSNEFKNYFMIIKLCYIDYSRHQNNY